MNALELVRKLDPYVLAPDTAGEAIRLSEMIAGFGWEEAQHSEEVERLAKILEQHCHERTA